MERRGDAVLEANRACSFSLKAISPLSPILHTCLTLEKRHKEPWTQAFHVEEVWICGVANEFWSSYKAHETYLCI